MQKKAIQIVTFNNPYPPNYGGAIDMYYKIKALSAQGVQISLHVFYEDRIDLGDLKLYCENIALYKRDRSVLKHLSFKPFAVTSRISKELVENLKASKVPVFFESLRTLWVLGKVDLSQKIAVRCHNIEHDYSWGLYRNETNWLKKIAYLLEGYKYKYFESILNKADILMPLSYYDFEYFKAQYQVPTYFLPVFQGNNSLESKEGMGTYALYHGDLSVADNVKSAHFILNVFKHLDKPLIIASSTMHPSIIKAVKACDNITFQVIKNEEQLTKLIKDAHINTLYSFQRSGTKLKVFNALFKGRFCIVNTNMVDDEDVLSQCEIAEDQEHYKQTVLRLFEQSFVLTPSRVDVLHKYQAAHNAEKIINIML